MDVKPVRPTRSTRPRQDENVAALQQKSKSSVISKGEKAVGGGLKAAARRSVFADVSNKVAMSKTTDSKENAKGAIVVPEQDCKAKAISKPAQRASGLKNAAANIHEVVPSRQAGPRRNTRKTAVYEDKKPNVRRRSPKRPSPKVSRDAITKRGDQLPSVRHNGFAVQAPIGPIARVKKVKEDEPVYSDQQPHLFDRPYVEDEDDNVAEAEYDDDATEAEEAVVAIDEKARFNADVEAVTDYEVDTEAGSEDYTTTRPRPGDETTGVTTQILAPKWTSKAREEIAKLNKQFVGFYDEDEKADISMVAEYGDEIFDYMRELEKKLTPNAHYMDFQSEIQWSMRAILMDWLVQVHARFNLLPETIFLCQNYIDRFLSSKVVSLTKLQLVGATALFVAAKYEEINCPSVDEIVYMVDNGYTAEEILKAERFMLSMLNFELGWPGPMSFLRRVSKADDYDLETRTLAKYFLEITIMDERFVASPPSFLAAGAHCLARHMLKKGGWTPAHTFYSGYTAAQLEPLVLTLVECCENPKIHHNAIYKKYADRRFKRASIFVANWMASEGPRSYDA
ncbi:cyclin-like protein [Sphaerosporella brunnea]|uniref:Cyclin-like protein n=1 Tax=Sphaerosporella brunnea TaxID=1250544 RepID=A0A5J5F7C9_9PEZI|nr:cyclin-like protein [Sphaerosporella brunnea]